MQLSQIFCQARSVGRCTDEATSKVAAGVSILRFKGRSYRNFLASCSPYISPFSAFILPPFRLNLSPFTLSPFTCRPDTFHLPPFGLSPFTLSACTLHLLPFTLSLFTLHPLTFHPFAFHPSPCHLSPFIFHPFTFHPFTLSPFTCHLAPFSEAYRGKRLHEVL